MMRADRGVNAAPTRGRASERRATGHVRPFFREEFRTLSGTSSVTSVSSCKLVWSNSVEPRRDANEREREADALRSLRSLRLSRVSRARLKDQFDLNHRCTRVGMATM